MKIMMEQDILGLSGENIHLYARIVKVADVFDALMEKRTYKKHGHRKRLENIY